jgi:hypothetical protein
MKNAKRGALFFAENFICKGGNKAVRKALKRAHKGLKRALKGSKFYHFLCFD